jgi:GT2 family glycosyltransferase
VTSRRPKVVLLGMMSKIPVAGVVWQTVHYLVGLERLGFETYYVEAHARTPSMFMRHEADDGSRKAAAFIDGVCRRFGLHDRWAFHALHEDGRCYGLGEERLRKLYASAELLINLHGGTEPLPEHAATGRLIYVETDPVQLQVELHEQRREALDFLEPHVALFSFGENLGQPDCLLPPWEAFEFKATRQPVVLDFWSGWASGSGELFTTVGNWRQEWRDVLVAGESYSWSKHHEFRKFLELPQRAGDVFELALAGCGEEDRCLLEQHRWRVRDAAALSEDVDDYRTYLCDSRGEFTVAKDQNVRMCTGWFSDRSATYLAAGRPVITQDTGFGRTLPTGEGLFAFSSLDEAVSAFEAIESNYERHERAAAEIARGHFAADVVLGRLLDDLGAERPRRTLAPGLDLLPRSRRPTTLAEETVESVLVAPLPAPAWQEREATVVVVTADGLVFTRLCLESVLAERDGLDLELLVVDNGSSDGTREYLVALAERDPRVRLVLNEVNAGFAAAANQGLSVSRGRALVLLNNDTIVPPGALRRLVRHLEHESVGLVGPVSNEAATAAEVEPSYRTYEELLAAGAERSRSHAGELVDVPMLTMFCIAMRRDLYGRVGPLDERFGKGLFEDDDYSLRVRRSGFRVACAADVLIHHFGEASFGKLVPSGEYASIFEANRRLFEEKWGIPWEPHGRQPSEEYHALVDRVRTLARTTLPDEAGVLVISKGDDALLELEGLRAAHFPQLEGGVYAGYYPRDSAEAIVQLESLTLNGFGADYLLVPETSRWWLDFYDGFAGHVRDRSRLVADEPGAGLIFSLRERPLKDDALASEANELSSPPPWEAVAAGLLEHAARDDGQDDIARLIAQLLPMYAKPPLQERYFRLFEDNGFHLTQVHYYSPIPDLRTLPDDLWNRESELPGLDLNDAVQLHLVGEVFPRFRDEYDTFPKAPTGQPFEYHLSNGMFDGTDALALYCMVRHFRPQQIVEVGSGWSTRVSAQAAGRNGDTELVCIEPYPTDLLKQGFPGLSRLIPGKVEEVELEFFTGLSAGDVLFIDSSHVVRTGGDVNYLFLEVLPRLAPGVLVHVHDVFFPKEYPRDWIVERLDFWSEQYLLQAFLAHNSAWEVLLSTSYLEHRYPGELRRVFPSLNWWGGGSFWMRRKEDAAL